MSSHLTDLRITSPKELVVVLLVEKQKSLPMMGLDLQTS
jgi:hypothetical protein